MKIRLSVCFLTTMLAALAGCAGVTTDIAATGALPEANAAARYRFAQSPAQAEAGDMLPGEPLLRASLARRGFSEGAPAAARYLVSVAWATRPAGVSVVEGDCNGGNACALATPVLPPSPPALPWFGKTYVHTLTLRFFALPEGNEVYKVSAVKRDRNANSQQAEPYLVAGALARLPYAGAPQWRVALKDAANLDANGHAVPEVKSVRPVTAP
ncbi:DUF4136 domain-containing protein [Paraburkholderia acidisoli]|uniref:DUF4136 domain-containing protein n=1 Tax=Paraburkholderia acidisoli TaxID=2571748 RepID=A0A7Z2GLV8_9BURK|nr:DUF4136 domain-containing protein [Paraburkholderia acidisoli]QGZ64197.1 DUF4136 domain-containing protein [Paraburkholderia acidisoli]